MIKRSLVSKQPRQLRSLSTRDLATATGGISLDGLDIDIWISLKKIGGSGLVIPGLT